MDSFFDIAGKVGALQTSLGQAIGSAQSSVLGETKAYINSTIKGLLNGNGLLNPNTTPGVGLGDSFAGMNARGDAVQNINWWCVLPTVGDVGFSGGNPVDLPWYYVQTSNLPAMEVTMNPITRNGKQIYFPNYYSVPDLNLVLFMDDKNAALKWYQAWRNMVVSQGSSYNPNSQGKWGRPGDYKKNINFVLYSYSNGMKNNLINIKYINCTPGQQTSFSELSSNNPEVMTLTVGLKVEDIEITVVNAPELTNALTSSGDVGVIGKITSGIQSAATNVLNQIPFQF